MILFSTKNKKKIEQKKKITSTHTPLSYTLFLYSMWHSNKVTYYPTMVAVFF